MKICCVCLLTSYQRFLTPSALIIAPDYQPGCVESVCCEEAQERTLNWLWNPSSKSSSPCFIPFREEIALIESVDHTGSKWKSSSLSQASK